MSAPNDTHQLALDRFLREQPQVAAELDSLNPLVAQARAKPWRSIAPNGCMRLSKRTLNSKSCSPGN